VVFRLLDNVTDNNASEFNEFNELRSFAVIVS